jgi:nicotinamide-nucleotide amidase
VGHRLTNVPGSSGWMRGGIVAYGNDVKTSLLGVPSTVLDAHGAVSVETAAAMARGARERLGVDVAVATTGVAGPDGGTPEKPVGTVCIGLATAADVCTSRYQLWGTRDWVKLLTSQIALDWLRREALGLEMTDSAILRRR